MHLPAKMAIWRKASDPGDPAGDVQEGGVGGGNQERERLHLTERTRIGNAPHTPTISP